MRLKCALDKGFSLIEVMVILTVLAALAAAVYALAPQFLRPASNADQENLLHRADRQLIGFAAAHGRLPYPDTNNDGIENTGATSGTLPYKTLDSGGKDSALGRIPIRYGLYRNAAASADLAVLKDRFNPVDPDGNTITLGNSNDLDLCVALGNAKAATPDNRLLHIHDRQVNQDINVAYVLAIAGATDADGVNGVFDGLNSSPGVAFEAPYRVPDTSYDDRVLARDFNSLAEAMSCDTVRKAMNTMAMGKAVAGDISSLALANKDNAAQSQTAAIISVADAGLALGMAIKQLVDNTATLSTAVTELATATASCVASLGLACGAVVTPAIAVGLASSGLALSAAAVGLYAAGVALAGVALGQNVAVAARANAAAASGGGSSLAGSISSLQTALNNANADVTQKQTALTNAQNASTTAQNNFTTSNTGLRNQINALKTVKNTPQQIQLNATAITALDAAITAQVNRFNAGKALQTAQTNQKKAQSNLNSKQALLNSLTAKKNCLAMGGFYDVTTSGGPTCRARTASDPQQQPVTTAQLTTAQNDVNAAQTSLNNATATVTNKQTLFNSAKTAASTTQATARQAARNAALNAYGISAGSSVGNNLASQVDTVVNNKQRALQKADAVLTAQQNLAKATQQRDKLQASLAQLRCMDTGGVYDATVSPPTCTIPPPGPSGTPITLFSGAGAILNAADAEGAAK